MSIVSFNTMFHALKMGDTFYISNEKCYKTGKHSYQPQRTPAIEEIRLHPSDSKFMLAEIRHEMSCVI